MCATASMWGSEDRVRESVFFFCHVDLTDQAKVGRLGRVLLPTEPSDSPSLHFSIKY